MAKPAWYNDNQFRDFPFLTRVYPLSETTGLDGTLFPLPHSAILDFCAIMEIDAEYDERNGDSVYLYSISLFGTVLTFKFRTTASACINHEVVVHRDVNDPEFSISRDYASTVAPELASRLICPLTAKWSATVVTGKLSDVASLLTDGETVTMPPELWRIEPARIQSLQKSYLRAVSLANAPRLHVTPQDGCSVDSVSSESAANSVILYKSCMYGDLSFKEGFNCSIRQDNNNNAIIIGAAVGVGAGEPCEEIPLHATEAPQNGSKFLSGGPACNEVVKAINGVGGDDVTLIPGPGFQIQPDTQNAHKLIINRALDDFVLCVADTVLSSSLSAGVTQPDPGDLPCDGLTADDIFQVTFTGGLLGDPTLNQPSGVLCSYDIIMSAGGNPSWVSDMHTVQFWQGDALCGFRWRAKVVCEPEVLRCSVMAYPLADNNPCKTCTTTVARPVSPPYSFSSGVTTKNNTQDCGCISSDSLVDHVAFAKVISL